MIPLASTAIAGITGGVLHGDDVLVDGPVVTDSRQAGRGSLYVARIGEFADGHDFARAAAAAGAVATLGLRAIDGMPTVVVDDVQRAFAALARAVVDRCPELRIIGITGSSGKTSTKDVLGQVLQRAGETVAPIGSLNSEVGVPLTVCRVSSSTRFLVAEMGASGVGHIGYLTRIAPPQIGVVLNVGSAHLGEFGSVENIARAKAELVQALPDAAAGGVAILNADDARVAAMAEQTSAAVVTVGRGAAADLRATDIQLDSGGIPQFTVSGRVHTPGGWQSLSEPVRGLQVRGEHQVGNVLAAIAAAMAAGLSAARTLDGLAAARIVSRWRMELHQLPTGVLLINDAYNANPDSMRAALRSLAQLGTGRRTVAVLGEMLELGDSSRQAHLAIGELAGSLGIDRLLAVGAGAAPIADAAGRAGVQVEVVPDVEAAHPVLQRLLKAGDAVLFKSSRDAGLRYLGDRIAAESGAELPS